MNKQYIALAIIGNEDGYVFPHLVLGDFADEKTPEGVATMIEDVDNHMDRMGANYHLFDVEVRFIELPVMTGDLKHALKVRNAETAVTNARAQLHKSEERLNDLICLAPPTPTNEHDWDEDIPL